MTNTRTIKTVLRTEITVPVGALSPTRATDAEGNQFVLSNLNYYGHNSEKGTVLVPRLNGNDLTYHRVVLESSFWHPVQD